MASHLYVSAVPSFEGVINVFGKAKVFCND